MHNKNLLILLAATALFAGCTKSDDKPKEAAIPTCSAQYEEAYMNVANAKHDKSDKYSGGLKKACGEFFSNHAGASCSMKLGDTSTMLNDDHVLSLCAKKNDSNPVVATPAPESVSAPAPASAPTSTPTVANPQPGTPPVPPPPPPPPPTTTQATAPTTQPTSPQTPLQANSGTATTGTPVCSEDYVSFVILLSESFQNIGDTLQTTGTADVTPTLFLCEKLQLEHAGVQCSVKNAEGETVDLSASKILSSCEKAKKLGETIAAQPPKPPTTSAIQACGPDFVALLKKFSAEVRSIKGSIDASQQPEQSDLQNALRSCDAFEKNFAGHRCTIKDNTGKPNEVDMTRIMGVCRDIKSLAGIPSTNTSPQAGSEIGETGEKTPVVKVASRIEFKVLNSSAIESALKSQGADLMVFTDGQALPLAKTAKEPRTFCFVAEAESRTGVTPLQNSAVYKAVMADESREQTPGRPLVYTTILVEKANFALVCVNTDGTSLTISDLKTSFGSALEITIK